MTTLVHLHVPNEPDPSVWRQRLMHSATLDEVVEKEDGVAAWLWERWQVLDQVGLDRARFSAIVVGYRREIWLWLMGERTWTQCCSGLIGRLERRMPAS